MLGTLQPSEPEADAFITADFIAPLELATPLPEFQSGLVLRGLFPFLENQRQFQPGDFLIRKL